MANLCYTEYFFSGDVEEIESKVTESFEDNPNLSIREMLELLDIEPKDDWNLRGNVIWSERSKDYWQLEIESAWSPCGEAINAICDKYDLDMIFQADERGCIGIWSNDVNHKMFNNTHVIYMEGWDEEWFESAEEALEWINANLKEDGKETIDSLSDAYDLDEISITEIEYGDFTE